MITFILVHSGHDLVHPSVLEVTALGSASSLLPHTFYHLLECTVRLRQRLTDS